MNQAQRIPLYLLTGFLGSGKTTILNQWVQDPAFSKALVIINEFGETSLDHLLVSRSTEEQIVELSNGCICCTIRGDLAKTLTDISWRFSRNGIKSFDKVIIETTGLADPSPILNTLISNEKLFQQYRLQGTVTTVDVANALHSIEKYSEAKRQVAVADLILLTKQDLVSAEVLQQVQQRVRQLNPTAPLQQALNGVTALRSLLKLDHIEPVHSSTPLANWLNFSAVQFEPLKPEQTPTLLRSAEQELSPHQGNIRAFCYQLDKPVSLRAIEMWLDALLPQMGHKLLRLKAILNVEGFPGPMVIHGVQQLLHPTAVLTDWPNDERKSKLVFITDELTAQQLEVSLQPLFRL
ncbi:GTP-binding protein [Rheinheimera sp. KL1]|uniref:CobW family GTP-binding protein n=1 Tax=Rheinheimera sp. KL1 TaxID=1635005 RepID=UPI000ACECBA9|nr:GTP-binding protein [Rheinheimera sp. KL1]